MDIDPDIAAAVALEAWVIARATALCMANAALARDAAVEQAITELRTRYPPLGGAIRRLDARTVFG